MISCGPIKSLLASALLLGPALVWADDDYPAWDVGWLLFGDLYHVASHHLPEGDGATGVVVRRGYLTFNADFNENWFGRLRFELNQDGEFESYGFEVDFKDLYVGSSIGNHRWIAGLQPTLTFDVVEAHWGLRSLMRTPMDLQGVPSRDTGLAFRGPLNDSGSWTYRAMLGLGVEFGNESGDGGKWMGALNHQINDEWMLDFYFDYEKLSGPRDRTTLQAFAGYETDEFRFGALYSHQDRESDPRLELASLHAIKQLGENSSLIGRIDWIIEPSPKGNNISYIPFDPSAPATMYVAGYEHRFNEQVRLTPNIIYTHYGRNDEGERPESDFHLRLTLFLDFE